MTRTAYENELELWQAKVAAETKVREAAANAIGTEPLEVVQARATRLRVAAAETEKAFQVLWQAYKRAMKA